MCVTPTQIKNPKFPTRSHDRYIMVPCGKCPKCLARRASGWAFRLWQEIHQCESAYFVTLTYDTAYVPISGQGLLTLDKSDFQKYMKRLRKMSNHGRKILYYAVGEYGGKTRRPHYHAVMFNAEKDDIEAAWKLGGVYVGDVSTASVMYVCKYLSKRVDIPDGDDRQKEFSLMSKGLGKCYINDSTIRFHQAKDDRNYVVLEGGIKVSLPRYYKEKIFVMEEVDESTGDIKLVPDKEEIARRANLARRNAAKAELRKSAQWKRRNPGKDFDKYKYNETLTVLQRHARKVKQERNKL